jgi:hypothetical protein
VRLAQPADGSRVFAVAIPMEAMHSTDAQTQRPAATNAGEVARGALWQRLLRVFRRPKRVAHRRGREGNEALEASPLADVGFVGFDEQRYYGDERRADIVFGPDMFDPRTENGARPLSRAVAEGHSDIDPADFEKSVGDVLGDEVDLDELARVSLKNADSIEVSPADAG